MLPKKIQFVVLGIILSILVFVIFTLLIDGGFSDYSDFYTSIILPVSLFIGGLATGYLIEPYIRRAFLDYLRLTPSLYPSLVLFLISISAMSIYALVLPLLMIFFSFIGVCCGVHLRPRKEAS